MFEFSFVNLFQVLSLMCTPRALAMLSDPWDVVTRAIVTP